MAENASAANRMSGIWTAEKIVALAPDAGSAKSGRDLANARKWVTLGRDDKSIWGECQGSGAKPYQTQIDPDEPAFKCSCPSRKFPCKHAIGLFLMAAEGAAAFKQTAAPAWVTEWLASRAQRAEKKAKKAEEVAAAAAAPPDPEAQARQAAAAAKRAAERQAKVSAGMNEIGLWLRDLVRHGLASAQDRPHGYWETPAARMVDAQAPGVARLIGDMSGIPATGDGWTERLLDRVGRLHLLVEAFKRMDTLPTPTVADVRTLVGWTEKQEELLATGKVLRDRWLVAGQRVEEDEEAKLRVQRTWLWGHQLGRGVLVLHFAPISQAQNLDTSLVVGTVLDAGVVFYSGAYPLRVLVKERHGPPAAPGEVVGYESVSAATGAYAAALAQNPWIERFPVALRAVVPARTAAQNGNGDRARDRWTVTDAEGSTLPLAKSFANGWQLLALSGGWPVALFGEWDGDSLLPLSARVGEKFIAL